MNTIYSFWLPIENFDEIKEKCKKNCKDLNSYEFNKNNNWEWIVFEDDDSKIIIDSLGFFYINLNNKTTADDANRRKNIEKVEKYIDKQTIDLIKHTFIHEKLHDKNAKKITINDFLDKTIVKFEEPTFKTELIQSCISTKNPNTSETIYTKKHLKISSEENDNFENLLNRNFEQLLERSLNYTNGLKFDNGEIYEDLELATEGDLSNLNFNLDVCTNGESIKEEKSALIKQIYNKALQDTIEEKVIQNFLKVTQEEYLKHIFKNMKNIYQSIVFKNIQMFADFDSMGDSASVPVNDLEEENIDAYIHELLGSIPLFHRVDAHIRESYYVKIGNTSNYAKVLESETVKSTYQYRAWIHYIDNFVETADKARDSLKLYHENKTLKELEDIGYNENYQADIEDIRDLKQKKVSLDEDTKNRINWIVLILAALTLSATKPLWEGNELLKFFSSYWIDHYDLLKAAANVVTTVILSAFVYGLILIGLYLILKYIIILILKLILILIKSFIPYCIMPTTNFYEYDYSDYDKHEHRSSKALYNYTGGSSTKFDKSNEHKATISYNDTQSALVLLNTLKNTELKRVVCCGTVKNFTIPLLKTTRLARVSLETKRNFSIFPSLLRELPKKNKTLFKNDQDFEFRENYRISRYDKVSTKLMTRYKITNLKLLDFINFIHKDNFKYEYLNILSTSTSNTNKDEEKIITTVKDILDKKNFRYTFKNNWDKVKLNLYIVYAFSLRLKDDKNKVDKNQYEYYIYKDQFRVHFHINKLPYTNENKKNQEISEQEMIIGELIYIYFLARMKRFYVNENSIIKGKG